MTHVTRHLQCKTQALALLQSLTKCSPTKITTLVSRETWLHGVVIFTVNQTQAVGSGRASDALENGASNERTSGNSEGFTPRRLHSPYPSIKIAVVFNLYADTGRGFMTSWAHDKHKVNKRGSEGRVIDGLKFGYQTVKQSEILYSFDQLDCKDVLRVQKLLRQLTKNISNCG